MTRRRRRLERIRANRERRLLTPLARDAARMLAPESPVVVFTAASGNAQEALEAVKRALQSGSMIVPDDVQVEIVAPATIRLTSQRSTVRVRR